MVLLEASGSSDPEGDDLSFARALESLPIGSLALISDPAAIKPSFQADEPGDTVARLTATNPAIVGTDKVARWPRLQRGHDGYSQVQTPASISAINTPGSIFAVFLTIDSLPFDER